MVTGESTDNNGDGRDNNRPSSFRYTERFEEECGYYLSIGMTYHDYWDEDAAMVKFYRDKHKRDLDRQNFNHWMQGMYIYEALVDASPVFNPLSEKHEPFPYMKEPIPITIEAIKETEERQNQQKMKNGKDAMRAWMVEFNKRFEEKQREGGEIDNEC